MTSLITSPYLKVEAAGLGALTRTPLKACVIDLLEQQHPQLSLKLDKCSALKSVRVFASNM